jgi:hypothetical protein
MSAGSKASRVRKAENGHNSMLESLARGEASSSQPVVEPEHSDEERHPKPRSAQESMELLVNGLLLDIVQEAESMPRNSDVVRVAVSLISNKWNIDKLEMYIANAKSDQLVRLGLSCAFVENLFYNVVLRSKEANDLLSKRKRYKVKDQNHQHAAASYAALGSEVESDEDEVLTDKGKPPVFREPSLIPLPIPFPDMKADADLRYAMNLREMGNADSFKIISSKAREYYEPLFQQGFTAKNIEFKRQKKGKAQTMKKNTLHNIGLSWIMKYPHMEAIFKGRPGQARWVKLTNAISVNGRTKKSRKLNAERAKRRKARRAAQSPKAASANVIPEIDNNGSAVAESSEAEAESSESSSSSGSSPPDESSESSTFSDEAHANSKAAVAAKKKCGHKEQKVRAAKAASKASSPPAAGRATKMRKVAASPGKKPKKANSSTLIRSPTNSPPKKPATEGQARMWSSWFVKPTAKPTAAAQAGSSGTSKTVNNAGSSDNLALAVIHNSTGSSGTSKIGQKAAARKKSRNKIVSSTDSASPPPQVKQQQLKKKKVKQLVQESDDDGSVSLDDEQEEVDGDGDTSSDCDPGAGVHSRREDQCEAEPLSPKHSTPSNNTSTAVPLPELSRIDCAGSSEFQSTQGEDATVEFQATQGDDGDSKRTKAKQKRQAVRPKRSTSPAKLSDTASVRDTLQVRTRTYINLQIASWFGMS